MIASRPFPSARVACAALALIATPCLPARAPAQNARCSWRWSPAADLLPGRFHHATTMLSDGTLLAAGGRNGAAALSAAALYVEDTSMGGLPGRWLPVPDLACARERHVAVPLANGCALVTGGILEGMALRSCELFEPASRSFLAFPDMIDRRYRHTLTLLPGGRVLAAGSENYNQGLDACELLVPDEAPEAAVAGAAAAPAAAAFTPRSWRWSSCASMSIPRGKHTATLLADGRVLVTGGVSGLRPTASCEIYDPSADTWTPAPAMSEARESHSATLLPDGRVFVAGGGGAAGELQSCEVFDPAGAGGAGAWSPAASMLYARKGHAALLIGGRVLVVFGAWYGGDGILYCEALDVADPRGTWTYAPPMLARRGYVSAHVLRSGRILLDAGETSAQTGQTRCDISSVPVVTGAAPAPEAVESRLRCFPNPASGQVTIATGMDARAGATTRAGATVEILSLTGRVLRRWSAADAATIAWDCRDAGGRRLPPGCYLVVLAAPGGRAAAPVLLLR